MRLLLDTAVLILAIESPHRLSRRAAATLQQEENILELSSISLSEIAIKANLGKLSITDDLLRQALRDVDVRILPYTEDHAFALFGLPPHHADPFDRQIIAQAVAEDIPVVTPDRAFLLYKAVKVIW